MIERSLVLVKPDGVQRGLIGEVIKRFEQRGLKIIGLKLTQIDEGFARKHYFDIGDRHGEKVLNALLSFITSGPVTAMVVEGVNAVENVRKIVGGTEPKSAQVGTIRGDFTHISYGQADAKDKAIPNIVHASGNSEEAKTEVDLWFSSEELYNYKLSHEEHTF